MLDIKFIREQKDLVQAGAKKKHIDFDVSKLIELDDKRLAALTSFETLRAEQNQMSNHIAIEKDPAKRMQMIEEMRLLKEDLKKREEDLREAMKEWQLLMLQVPNIPDMTVPEGETDEDNVETKVVGEKRIFDFEPKDHVTLMEALDLADFERGTKVAGFRGYFLKNEGAELEMALWNLAKDLITPKGYSLMRAPSLVRRESFVGTGFLPQSEEDLYKVGDNEYLTGTAEVPTMGYYMDEVLEENSLPKKFISFSACFRAEAGKHGKDVKGLYRVHEFFKMEQVILCEANHATSVQLHEELTANAEELVQALGLPYHIVTNCGGDLGLGQVKKYDIEAWMPSQQKYRETHSSSYFHDFQTRRLNIRYKDTEGKLRYAHSLNNTAVATPRIIAHIVENYQNADGSIRIPEVLQKYMGGKTLITKKS
jgi:seryl-tRNA synthetase